MSDKSSSHGSAAKWRSIADRVFSDHRAGHRFEPFASASGVHDLAAAYAVQREYVHLQQSAAGTSTAGYKIGLTSRQMQDMCGIDSPVAGVVSADRVFRTPAEIDGSRFGRLGLEFEIAVRMGKDVPRTGGVLSLGDVGAAVDAVCAAIELVDDRHCDYKTLDVLSLVADNSWNAGIVCGTFAPQWSELADVEGIALAGGVELGRGFGRDALGHPFIPLTWLANHLADSGTFLRAGDIVMTGSLIRTHFPAVTTEYRFDLRGLGHVSCRVDL